MATVVASTDLAGSAVSAQPAPELQLVPVCEPCEPTDGMPLVALGQDSGGTLVICCRCKCERDKDLCTYLVKAKTENHKDMMICRSCNSLDARMKSIRKNDEALAVFTKVDSEHKRKFYNDNHALMGQALAAAMEDTIVTTLMKRCVHDTIGDAEWLDEDEIRNDRFKARPKIADALIKNARKWWDPDRECWLYEVISYKTKSLTSNSWENKRVLQVKQESAAKKAKVAPKAKAKAKAIAGQENVEQNGQGNGDEKQELKPKDIAQLTKLLDDVKTKHEDLSSNIKVLGDSEIKDMIAPFIKSKLLLFAGELQSWVDEAELILEEKKASDFNQFKSKGQAMKKDVVTHYNKSSKSIDEALEELDKYIEWSDDGSAFEFKQNVSDE